MARLEREFFARDTLEVARDLLGRVLVRLLDGERLSGRIVEVEAYIGEEDLASHARVGRTERNAAMYGPPGHAYVYLIYGMYHCLNLVTGPEGFPAAVLVRALEPLEGLERMRDLRSGRPQLTNGPGRLCQALAIDRRFDGADLCASAGRLFVEEGRPIDQEAVVSTPRVGVRGDERARSALWRLYLRDNPWVSRS
ncbi:MAG TPA: DNA-3-methyladenine glycosylase [Anaerolineales bacterium]|nr:DNA-3-methyladenine glycosylase [Anaerolineae bacterium]HIQ01532.1 DNA-3-methyladenine glycosylase [Anaerolineales bacterium]